MFKHFLKAWPILAVILMMVCHCFIWIAFRPRISYINRILGASLQVIGAMIFITYTISSNLNIFFKESLWSIIMHWIVGFRHLNKPIPEPMEAYSVMDISVTKARLSGVYRDPTIEQRVEMIEHALKLQQSSIDTIEQELASIKQGIDVESASSRRDIKNLSEKLENSLMRGSGIQFLGGFTSVYGIIVSAFLAG